MENIKIYYNSNCSKCQQTMSLLKKKNTSLKIVEYLNSPLPKGELTHVMTLGIPAKDLIRTHEDEWKNTGLNIETASDDELINAIIQHPILLQRPIVIANGKAVIARPPEKVLEIL